MTREEMIEALNEIKECPIGLKAWYVVALEGAIKALEQEPFITLDDFRRYAIEHNYEIMTVEQYKKAMSILLQEPYETSTDEPMTME